MNSDKAFYKFDSSPFVVFELNKVLLYAAFNLKIMKLFTNEGFSVALQITSLVMLVGYSVFNQKNESKVDLKETTSITGRPAVRAVYRSNYWVKNNYKQRELPFTRTNLFTDPKKILLNENSIDCFGL